MVFLYRLLVHIVKFLLPLAAGFSSNPKLKAFAEAQKKGIPDGVLPKTGKRFWFHCASLGEFEQARPLMERLKEKEANNSIVITFFSHSGYSQRYQYPLADKVIYLPLDTPKNAKKLQDYLQADVAVFVKYELWYFHLNELFKRKIPVYLISAVFREGQFLFSKAGKWLFNILPQYDQIFVQDKNSLELLLQKGLKNVRRSGDTRFDRVKQNALKVELNGKIESFKSGRQILIIGSSWPEEEKILLSYLQMQKEFNFKIIIAPHDISNRHILEIKQQFAAYRVVLYTDDSGIETSDIMVLNTMGHLASAYHYADMAFIGGGFGKGLHNILEALAFGVPVVFGPNIKKYPEASLAMEQEVARIIKDANDLRLSLVFWLKQEETLLVRSKCIDFINWHSGATDMVLKVMMAKV